MKYRIVDYLGSQPIFAETEEDARKIAKALQSAADKIIPEMVAMKQLEIEKLELEADIKKHEIDLLNLKSDLIHDLRIEEVPDEAWCREWKEMAKAASEGCTGDE